MDDLLEHQADVLEIMHPTMQQVMVTQDELGKADHRCLDAWWTHCHHRTPIRLQWH